LLPFVVQNPRKKTRFHRIVVQMAGANRRIRQELVSSSLGVPSLYRLRSSGDLAIARDNRPATKLLSPQAFTRRAQSVIIGEICGSSTINQHLQRSLQRRIALSPLNSQLSS
jgi:hypothetical protein